MSAREPLRPAYLIHGSDRPKVDLAVRRLRSRVEDEGGSVEQLVAGADEGQVGAAEAVDSCNALGLFGGLRLVLVTGVEDKWVEAGGAIVAAYLASPAPDAVLALVGEKLKPGSALAEAVGAAGVLHFDLPERKELPAWVRQQAQRAGLDLHPDGARRLIELGGHDPLALSSEIDKLATWAAGASVGAEEVDAMCVLDPDLPPWDLTDALGARDATSTLEVLGRFLDQRDADVARVLPSLARHLRQLHATSLLLDQGAGAEAVAKALGLRSAFPARKLCQQASRWSREELSAALARVALIEAETRGESVLPDRFSLELGLGEALVRR